MNNKIKDAGQDISAGSRADKYWRKQGFDKSKVFKMRMPALVTQEQALNYVDYYDEILNTYGFKGIEFGNWVKLGDRYNFMLGAVLALHDIQEVIKMPGKTIGFNKLGLAFGARGVGGKAAAHFEPGSFVINLTRHSRGLEFGGSGGLGSMAHEYGHALDYYFGTFHNPKSRYRSLTKGSFVGQPNFSDDWIYDDSLTGLTNLLIYKMVNDANGNLTPYYAGLLKAFGEEQGYWFRHNELFARAFEQYVAYKLQQKGIVNTYLTKQKYVGRVYMDDTTLHRIIPTFDKLIKKMAETLKK